MAGFVPLLVMDVWEHAFLAERPKYHRLERGRAKDAEREDDGGGAVMWSAPAMPAL